jgi:hypothetical protein
MVKKILFLILVLLVLGCAKSEIMEGEVTIIIETLGETLTEEYGYYGISLYEMLDERHDLKMSHCMFLKCVEEICGNKEYSWAIYVNGDIINFGVDYYIVNNGDKIEVLYE